MNNPNLGSLTKEELIDLASVAIPFKQQQKKGKRPEYLQRYISGIVSGMPEPTFKELLHQLGLAAARRELKGEKASPIEKVDRVFELVTYHSPRKGRIQTPFGTIWNHLTKAKKNKFTVLGKP